MDATLASNLASVEQSIDVYLKDPSVDLRTKLLDVLERLDAQIDRSDAYENSVIGSAALGYSSKGSVIGETSSASAAENISEPVLLAQTILIKAAKREVTTPTPETLADLRTASQALDAERSKQVD
ncbi:MAG TPA: hypothetical protein VGF51_01940 [Acidimicrobiales bacterium]